MLLIAVPLVAAVDTFARTASTSVVYGVPGEDEDCAPGHSFTGTWEQNGRAGAMACIMGPGAYVLLWNENTRLVQVGFNVVDPELEATDDRVDAAVSWEEDNATLDCLPAHAAGAAEPSLRRAERLSG